MSTSPRTRRLLSGALSAALLLSAGLAAAGCSDDGGEGTKDISKARFLENFSEASGLKAEISTCVVDELFRQLDQDAINDFYGPVEENEPLSASNKAALDAAVTKCTKESLVIPTSTTAPTGTTAPTTTTVPAG